MSVRNLILDNTYYNSTTAVAFFQVILSTRADESKPIRGINRAGAEYSCVQDNGIFEGPVDEAAVAAMMTWNVNAVRIPLNEDCWLGINGHNIAYSGSSYRSAVVEYVQRLRDNGLKVILALHWTDGVYSGAGQGTCCDEAAMCQKPMPDMENAPAFWKSIAEEFKGDDGIIFDLFNEPYPDQVMSDSSAAWACWRDGSGSCTGFEYEVAGMQDLVDAVRNTGSTNQVMVGGLAWANDLSRWAEFAPNDTADNIAASWHSYSFNACNDEVCWESVIATLAAEYSVIAGEIGEHGCSHDYIDELMSWLDGKDIGYLGWTWNTWDCSSGPALISDYNGTPTEFGVGLKNHLSSLAYS